MNHVTRYFIYCRKSSEEAHRQIASINDQFHALQQIVQRENLTVIGLPFVEERSAKDPGRPIFNEMLKRIKKGEADALLCWDIDRLSRNPIDTGQLQWMLQKSDIKIIKTPGRSFYPDDAGLLLSIEGGRATDYVVRLAKNVKRGMYGRAMSGWRPIGAPIGYLNVGFEKRNKTIEPDPERFEIIHKMWNMLLSGGYSVAEILNIATNDWELRTKKHRKVGGNPITVSHIYHIFKDPFYYGYYEWKEPETNIVRFIKGKHKPMITEREYWHAQVILGRKGKSQPKTREFAFTGCMTCEECQSSITAEEKNQVICSVCKHKFSYVIQTQCSKCYTDISDMKNPTILQYTYYHCTKKKNTNCNQKSVKLEDLELQIVAILEEIRLDKGFVELFKAYSQTTRENIAKEEIAIKESLQSAYSDCLQRLDNLNKAFLSPLNTNNKMYSEGEFLEQKQLLITERYNLVQKMQGARGSIESSLNILEQFINFCVHAKEQFVQGDLRTKRTILKGLGQNLKLNGKKLYVERLFPHLLLKKELGIFMTNFDELEPENTLSLQEPNAIYSIRFPMLCSAFDSIRTWIHNNKDFIVPKLSEEINSS